ncbi:MAG: hypothetical protein B1H03_00005 [Planctomycetales bacterium 4484_113]|nr:MAG: hypothetical protein B1H03_00005 [Planctomycetales bacterium 4484_113]
MAKERGFDALAVTDRNGLYGAIQFYKLAKEAGVKPIIGVSLDEPLTTGDGGGRTSGKRAEEPTQPLTLLAKNRLGYAELCHLADRRLHPPHRRPRAFAHAAPAFPAGAALRGDTSAAG